MQTHWIKWLELAVRWFHVIMGAAWIGTSFYFNFLNHALRPPREKTPGVKSEMWAIHGGAFYRVLKFDGAPEKLPETLHWWKWEAYLTLLSGFSLLVLVYWLQARALMIDPAVHQMTPAMAVVVGAYTLIGTWIVYDLLCRSSLGKKPLAFAGVGYGLVVALGYGLSQVMSGRAAFMHVGAALGACMALNVFFVIIPGQKAMVKAMEEGRPPPVGRGVAGAQRSLHNNYITLPVLFVMISNHYSMTWSHELNWLILAMIVAAGGLFRHYFNVQTHGRNEPVWVVAAAALMVAVGAMTAPPTTAAAELEGPPVTFAEAEAIIQNRCLPCHSNSPTIEGFGPSVTKGIVFETRQDIVRRADAIYEKAVLTDYMPLGNMTHITDEERAALGRWARSL